MIAWYIEIDAVYVIAWYIEIDRVYVIAWYIEIDGVYVIAWYIEIDRVYVIAWYISCLIDSAVYSCFYILWIYYSVLFYIMLITSLMTI